MPESMGSHPALSAPFLCIVDLVERLFESETGFPQILD